MKRALILLAAVSCAFPAMAGGLTAGDAGTYVLLDRHHRPVDMFFRLYRQDGKWFMDGKKPGAAWSSISCAVGCEYRDSNAAEIKRYFPAGWRAHTNISCIQNIAEAFCHYTLKKDLERGGYVMITLVSGHPVPLFVRRVAPLREGMRR